MHETNGDGRDTNLAWQAVLYASGELDAGQTAEFENRLGNDQAAREALSLAASFAVVPVSGAPARPNPAYRDKLREQLRRGPGLWQWLCGRRAYRGHPLLWGLGGAAAAVLLMVSFTPSPCPRGTSAGPDQPTAAVNQTDREPVLSSLEAANIWAELSQTDHLLKAHGDEARRKSRQEEWNRRVNSDSYRSRVPMNPCN